MRRVVPLLALVAFADRVSSGVSPEPDAIVHVRVKHAEAGWLDPNSKFEEWGTLTRRRPSLRAMLGDHVQFVIRASAFAPCAVRVTVVGTMYELVDVNPRQPLLLGSGQVLRFKIVEGHEIDRAVEVEVTGSAFCERKKSVT